MKKWTKPLLKTVGEEDVGKVIIASACSFYLCWGSRMESTPPILL